MGGSTPTVTSRDHGSRCARSEQRILVDHHDVIKTDRVEVGNYYSLSDALRRSAIFTQLGARDLLPFIRKLARGGDFTWADLERAAGQPLRVDYFTV
jgi:hypothetical protein